MGRPRGSKNKPKDAAKTPAPENDEVGIGHNKVDLTDEQRQALTFQHKRSYSAALDAKKTADAAFKNVCKLAKAELGADAVDTIKDMIALETEEGEAKLKARIERQLRAARWMGLPIGAQGDLLDEVDRTPAVERAFAEGKRAGMNGDSMKPPYDTSTDQHQQWCKGWHAGQEAIFAIQDLKQPADGLGLPAAENPGTYQIQ